jgi:protein-L-isoaspartate(D-aspartate) O-methyltransferase
MVSEPTGPSRPEPAPSDATPGAPGPSLRPEPPCAAKVRPRREPDEIRRLLAAGHPFHLATRLTEQGVTESPDALRAHLALPVPEQQRLLAEALIDGGADSAVAHAVASVPRHELLPAELRERAYLDEFHRTSEGSGLTPPSLVALMIERLRLEPGQRVLELGVGSGFHALALLRLQPDLEVVGVEIEGRLLERARSHVARFGPGGSLTLLHGDGAEAARAHAPFDRVYATFAVRRPATRVLPVLREGGLALIPRAVGPHELAREPLLASLRAEHPAYESFLEVWQRNLCLTTYRAEGGHLQVVAKLYGFSFVGEREGLL